MATPINKNKRPSEAADIQVDTAMDLGADAYVFKPVTLEELEEALETVKAKRNS